jgi:hypothetical protein
MQREASSCDLKELVGKFIPESIGEPPWSDPGKHSIDIIVLHCQQLNEYQ